MSTRPPRTHTLRDVLLVLAAFVVGGVPFLSLVRLEQVGDAPATSQAPKREDLRKLWKPRPTPTPRREVH